MRSFLSAVFAVAAIVLSAGPVAAATVATPDPALPGDSVTLQYNDKTCAVDWRNLASAGIGVLVIDWPDGTTTLVDPVTDPVIVTVPAGMTAGTASISLHKGSVGNGEYEACQGSFTVAKEATVPVIDPAVGAATGLAVLGGFVVFHRSSKRRVETALA